MFDLGNAIICLILSYSLLQPTISVGLRYLKLFELYMT